MYINSNQIKVYPTARRSNSIDYSANLNLEENVTGMIKNITDFSSYIIDEESSLDLIYDTANSTLTIKAGKCVIDGYFIQIKNDIVLNKSLQDIADKSIYLELSISNKSIGNNSYSYIDGYDTNGNNPEYTGVSIKIGNLSNIEDTQLVLGVIDSNGQANIAVKGKKFKANITNITLNKESGLINPTLTSINSTLEDWLEETFVVDDGEI